MPLLSGIRLLLPLPGYRVVGQVFCTSLEKLTESFDINEALDMVVINLCRTLPFWQSRARQRSSSVKQ